MRVSVVLILLILLVGCAYQPNPSPNDAYEALEQPPLANDKQQTSANQLPEAVANFLTQPMQADDSTTNLVQTQRFVLQASDVEARDFFYSLTVDTP